MKRFNGQALNLQDVRVVDGGDPLGFADINAPTGATVTVRDVSGGGLSTVFSDNGVTGQTNPWVADAEGAFHFYAANGRYNVIIDDGLATEKTIGDVLLSDEAGLVKNFDTLATAIADTGLVDGDTFELKERTTGKGGGAKWDVVLSSTVVENTFNIVQGVGVATLSFVLINPTMIKAGASNSIDSTPVAVAVNAATNVVIFDPDSVITMQNWVPLTGTTVKAKGAQIDKHGSVTYLATGSSGALVLANDNVKVQGGTWGETVAQTDFSGSIVLDDGENCEITGAKFIETWGGIVGHETQNGTNEMTDLLIQACVFDGCFHNTYLADIDGLTYTKNFSKNSNRDGLKLFRNARNSVITDNHIYNNGDGTGGQSRDGIDTFIAGDKCIITGNFLYGNKSKGLDIKRAPDGDLEAVVSGNYVIANNFIYSNEDIGLEVDNASGSQADIPLVNIHDNQVYSNTQRGMFIQHVIGLRLVDNDVYLNGTDGIRLDDISEQALVTGNHIYENGQTGASVGLLVQSTVTNLIAHSNRIRKGATGNQNDGVISSASPAKIKDNDVSGHSGVQLTTSIIDGTCTGSMHTSSLTSGVPDVAIINTSAGQLSSIVISINQTESVNVEISKRNVSTGAFEDVIHNAAVSFTAYVGAVIPISASASDRVLAKNQVVYINVTAGAWTSATALTSIID